MVSICVSNFGIYVLTFYVENVVWFEKKKDKKDYAMTFIIFSFQETAFTVLLRVYLM